MKSLIPHTLPPWVALTGMAVDGDLSRENAMIYAKLP